MPKHLKKHIINYFFIRPIAKVFRSGMNLYFWVTLAKTQPPNWAQNKTRTKNKTRKRKRDNFGRNLRLLTEQLKYGKANIVRIFYQMIRTIGVTAY